MRHPIVSLKEIDTNFLEKIHFLTCQEKEELKAMVEELLLRQTHPSGRQNAKSETD